MNTLSSLLLFIVLTTSAWGQQIKIAAITNESEPASKAVATALRSKINSHPKQFELVNDIDSGAAGLVVLTDCLPQKQKTDPFVCFYTAHYSGGTSKTFMGGGVYLSNTADEEADNFLASVAQDIVERWDEMVRANAIESLEACLFLTQSSCKVPGSLEKELKTKIINLSQYLQKGGLKK
jgi:hypothetical protein